MKHVNGRVHHKFTGSRASCVPCTHPECTAVRQVAIFAKNQPGAHEATALMKRAIDTPRGRRLYSQRIGTVEPVFANLRHNKRLSRFTLRGRTKGARSGCGIAWCTTSKSWRTRITAEVGGGSKGLPGVSQMGKCMSEHTRIEAEQVRATPVLIHL